MPHVWRRSWRCRSVEQTVALRCLVVDDDPVARVVLEQFVAQDTDLVLVGSCATALEAAAVLRGTPVDVLLLDVEMPGMSGLELLATLEPRFDTILVTGKQDFAVHGFEAGVTDYLVKPVSHARFLKAVNRVRQRRSAAPVARDRSIFVRVNRSLIRLDLTDITRVEAERDYVVFHTTKTTYRVRATLEAVAKRLPPDLFVRIHRSHVVRLDRVVDFEHNSVVVGSDVIPVGAAYRAALLKRMGAA